MLCAARSNVVHVCCFVGFLMVHDFAANPQIISMFNMSNLAATYLSGDFGLLSRIRTQRAPKKTTAANAMLKSMAW
jgi:hypothetical protein